MGKMTFKNTTDFRAMVRYCALRKPQGAYETRLKPDTKVCLWLVHDQGVYLMPGIEEGGKAAHIIYARGCDPEKNVDTWYDRAHDLVGGDDFAESIEFSTDQVDKIIDGTITKLEIQMSETSMQQTLYFKPEAVH